MLEKKKKKLSSSGKSAKEKMLERKKQLEKRGNGGGLIYPKEGTTRIRLKSPGEDEEIGKEIITFFLGKEMGGIISPATFDEPCPFMEKYQELKASSDDDDKELAKKIVPKRKYVIGGIGYKDEKGKEIDPDQVNKGFQVSSGVYQDLIDLYLDEDEWGDMTDDIEGYDIKITRSGKGITDTKYTVSPCQKKQLDKKYRGTIDLEAIVKSHIPSYEELEEKLRSFLNESSDDEDEERPKKKKKKGIHKDHYMEDEKPKKKKKYRSDI